MIWISLSSLASFWRPTLSDLGLTFLFTALIFSLSLFLFKSRAVFQAHMLVLSLPSCNIDTVVLPVPFLSLVPLRMPQGARCYGFSKGRLPSSSCRWDDTIISFQTSISVFFKFKTVTSVLKCQDRGICPEGLSQTINAHSANTMNSLKKLTNLRSFTHFWWHFFDALNTACCFPCLSGKATIKDGGLFLSFSVARDLQTSHRLLQA